MARQFSSRLSVLALSVLIVFMMSAGVECQLELNSTSDLSTLLVTHLEHTIDNLSSFTNIVSLLGGIAGLG